MMKPIRFFALLLLLFGVMGGILAQTTNEAVDPALRAQLDQLEARTEALRDLTIQREVTLEFPTRAEVQAFVADQLSTSFTDESTAEMMAFYVAFDFLPPDFDIEQAIRDLLGAQVAGFYDPEAKSMNVITVSGEQPSERLPLLEQIIYVHEYVHVLQDQYFDLEALLNTLAEEENVDRLLAVQSLYEGDASFVMNAYTVQASQEDPFAALLELLSSSAASGGLVLPPGTPPIFEAELTFPYVAGEQFVSSLRNDGSWTHVNEAFDNLPQSTEQIIHPEKYLAGENPVMVELADQSRVLGDGWVSMDDGTLGEFYIREYLETQLANRSARTAAAGWGGDGYRIYSNGDALAWQLRVVWDTPRDAREFAGAYEVFLEERMPDATLDGECTVTDAQTICLVAGEDETLISSAPTLDDARTLLDLNAS